MNFNTSINIHSVRHERLTEAVEGQSQHDTATVPAICTIKTSGMHGAIIEHLRHRCSTVGLGTWLHRAFIGDVIVFDGVVMLAR
ncbi:hypothetical protein CSQ96_13025 [Janthinobacterium sp. BJB412]|nr:hypothetical protein CSQ96_13025 [Janthinobacterium sp. BJB412]